MSRVLSLFICFIGFSLCCQQQTISVGYFYSPPFTVKKSDQLSGPSAWLWEKVTKDLGLKSTLYEGELAPLLDSVSSNSYDVIISPLAITHKRYERMDFSIPYYVGKSTLAVKSQTELEQGLGILASFFSLNFFKALGALCIVILVFGLLIWVFERKGNKEEFGPGFNGVMNGFWWSAVTMTTVGYGDKSPRTPGGRIIALIWMFTAIIIISGFTASIASSLTVKSNEQTVSQISDLKEMQVATVTNSSTEDWLEQHFIHNTNSYPTITDALAALVSDKVEIVAFDKPVLNYLQLEENEYDFELLQKEYNSQYYAFAFSKTFPKELQEEINARILEITESVEWKIVLSEFGIEAE